MNVNFTFLFYYLKMLFRAIFFFSFLLTKCCYFCAPNTPSPLTFSPIVTELAQKIVEECVEEYRKMVEHRPHIRIISGPETVAHPAFQNHLAEFKYLWVEFHAILSKVMLGNTFRNYRQIAHSCQMSDEPPVSLFCDFGKSFAFVKRYFEELKWRTKMEPKLVGEVREMLAKMEAAYQIGWEFAGRISHLNIRTLAFDVQNALGQIKFRHQFEAVGKHWAQKVLEQLANSCKNFANSVEQYGRTSRRNTFQMATNALKNVELQPPNSSSSNNQSEIDETCATLYSEYLLKNLCMFAKKLAYLATLHRMFGVVPSSPASSSSFVSCWPMKRKHRNKEAAKAVDECVDRMKDEYEVEVGKLAKSYWGPMRRHFVDRMAFERHAQCVDRAVEETEGQGGTNRRSSTSNTSRRGGRGRTAN